jgi:tetratricopeptide (TPR) repeat protein
MGLINMERGRYAKAREYFEKCWSITSHGVGFTSRMAAAKAYMAELAVRTGELDEAADHADEAIRLAREANVRQELAHAAMVQAMIATERGNWDKALECFDSAQSLFRDLGARYDLGRTHAAFGSMYLRRNESPEDHALAKEHIDRARAILTELGAKAELDRLPVL